MQKKLLLGIMEAGLPIAENNRKKNMLYVIQFLDGQSYGSAEKGVGEKKFTWMDWNIYEKKVWHFPALFA